MTVDQLLAALFNGVIAISVGATVRSLGMTFTVGQLVAPLRRVGLVVAMVGLNAVVIPAAAWGIAKASPMSSTFVAGLVLATLAAQHAIDAAHSLLGPKSADGVATFDVPGVPGAVGLRVMASSWLLVQPPNLGPMFDSVTIVYGTTVIETKVTNDTEGHEAGSGLALSVNIAAISS